MKTCFYYFAVAPFKNQYVDSDKKKPLVSIIIEAKNKLCEIGFYGSKKKGEIHFVRISIPDCKEKKLTESELEMVQNLKEHAISVLRLVYDPELYFAGEFWSYQEKKKKGKRLHLKIQPQKIADFDKICQNIHTLYCGTFSRREKFRLVADSIDPKIPTQYRLLSLHKIIELSFKKENGRFNSSAFDKFLVQFNTPGLRKRIFNLRDKCAHIRDNKGLYGVTQLTRKELREVEEFLPFYHKIINKLLEQEALSEN